MKKTKSEEQRAKSPNPSEVLMPAPQLTVHNAEIKTATVEIKTLTVSGKQVTLAVFRQLREEPLIADDGTFNGVPWGTVNYHVNKWCDDPRLAHLHVVWQQGSELRRAVVERPSFKGDAICADHGKQWLDAAVLDGWHPRGDAPSPRPTWKDFRITFGAGVLDVTADEMVLNAVWPRALYWSWDEGNEQEMIQKCRTEALAAIRERVGTVTKAELEALVESEIADEMARRERHFARWEEVKALPQLFIAV